MNEYSAEHGCFLKYPKKDWINLTEGMDLSWQGEVLKIFDYYTERTPGKCFCTPIYITYTDSGQDLLLRGKELPLLGIIDSQILTMGSILLQEGSLFTQSILGHSKLKNASTISKNR
jgi:hypothetical protein